MIALIMIGLAALLFTLSVVSLQIGSATKPNALVSGTLMIVFVINIGVCGMLIMAAMTTAASVPY